MSCIQEQPTEGVHPNARENGQIRIHLENLRLMSKAIPVRAGKSSPRGVLPGLDIAGRDCVALKIAGETHSVAAAVEAM